MSEKIILDHVPQIKMSRLKEWGYLKDSWCNFAITWRCNLGWRPEVCVNVSLVMLGKPHLVLNYTYNDKPIRYTIELVSTPSNLGRGLLWYFLCPHTGKRCNILHLIGGYFYHRTAFKNVCYLSETFSTKYKEKYKQLSKLNKRDAGLNMIYSKHFRPYYNGEPTKRFLKAMKWIEEGEGMSEEEIYYT